MGAGGRKLGRFIPSPSMGVALLALFVALSTSAWAAAKVGTKQIKNNAVTAPKIRSNAVTTLKLKAAAVTGSKIATGAVVGAKLGGGAVTGPKITSGAVGTDALADLSVVAGKIASGAVGTGALADQSVTSAKIADGAVFGSKVSVTTSFGAPVSLPPGVPESVTATCPEGRTAVSAGYEATDPRVTVSRLYVADRMAFVLASSPVTAEVTARVICI